MWSDIRSRRREKDLKDARSGRQMRKAEGGRQARESRWSEPVAVGSEGFVPEVPGKPGRRRIEVGPVEERNENTWRAQEVPPCYSRF